MECVKHRSHKSHFWFVCIFNMTLDITIVACSYFHFSGFHKFDQKLRFCNHFSSWVLLKRKCKISGWDLHKHKEHWSKPSKTHGERCEVATWEISDDVLLNGEYGDTCHIE